MRKILAPGRLLRALDIRDFFGNVNHDWLVRFLELRIGDKRVIRLIANGSRRVSSKTGSCPYLRVELAKVR
jgi:RNA-directed DNA polymerase